MNKNYIRMIRRVFIAIFNGSCDVVFLNDYKCFNYQCQYPFARAWIVLLLAHRPYTETIMYTFDKSHQLLSFCTCALSLCDEMFGFCASCSTFYSIYKPSLVFVIRTLHCPFENQPAI